MQHLIPLLALVLALPAASIAGVDPAVKCQAAKIQAQGVYASCRLKADAKAAKKSEAADYTKCEDALGKKFAKAEDKAGPGVCPTEGDLSEVRWDADRSTTDMTNRVSPVEAGCPAGYPTRAGMQIVQDLWSAIGAQDWDLVACNFYDDASIIDDQGILVGHTDIVTSYQSLVSLFDGIAPSFIQLDEFQDTVRVLYNLNGGWVHIEDGVEAFEFAAGRIRSGARHGLITFTGPPPES